VTRWQCHDFIIYNIIYNSNINDSIYL
jgi:hypothetical protein